MRKQLTVAVAAITAALVLAAPAMAVGPKQQLGATIKPTKIGKKPKKPVGVSLFVNPFFDIASADGLAAVDAAPFATRIAHVYFDKAFVFNKTAFKSCAPAVAERTPDACPKGSEVGSGNATGRAIKITQDNLVVRAFNGPGKQFLLRVDASSPKPLDIHAVIKGTLKTSTGAYGSELVFAIPTGLQEPLTGIIAALTDFRTTIPAKPLGKGKVSYVAVKSCPKGGLKMGYKGEYTDSTSQTVAIKVKCS